MQRRTYYEILGVRPKASADQIRSAYRQLARRYHPDQNPDDAAAEEAFKAVAEAYRVLNDPDSKHAYDAFGIVPAGAAYSDLQLPPKRSVVDRFRDVVRSAARAVRRGKDVRLDITLRFVDAVRGTHRVLELPRLNGGAVEPRRLRFDLPPGLETGKILRWPGEGEPERTGGRAGDLFLTVTVTPHPLLWRDGSDIRCALPLTLPEALAGTAVSVPTLRGPEVLDVPSGAWAGDELRLRGRGVPTATPGDAIFEVQLIRPPDAPETQSLAEALYETAARPAEFSRCLKESAEWRND